MDFLLAEELASFEQSLRQYLAKHINSAMLRSTGGEDLSASPVFHEDLWSQLVELGVPAAPVPEKHGGLGLGILSAELLLGLSGEFLVPVPVFESVGLSAAILSVLGGTAECSELLSALAAGEVRATAALEALFGQHPLLDASSKQDECRLSGSCRLCPSLEFASRLIVPARHKNSGVALYAVEVPSAAVKHQRVATFDCVRPYYDLTLDSADARRLTPDLSPEKLQKVRCIAALAASAEMTGAAKRAVALSVEYAKTRQQFGRPIGSFQAVSHKLADMHVATDSCAALVRFAAWACDNDPLQQNAACSAAKAYCSNTCPKVAQDAIQVHGGIGFTYEYDLHLFLRRTRTLAPTFGTAELHSKELAAAPA